MQNWRKEVPFESNHNLTESIFQENAIFFDIETTGFSPTSTSLYLIGCAYRSEGNICIEQFFADSPLEESMVLSTFLELLSRFETLITFNGIGFDIPYLKAKCLKYHLHEHFDDYQYLDIFKSMSRFKHILKLQNFKQKTVEAFLGLNRDDAYSGGELINVYHDYMKIQTDEAAHLLRLHNYEDVLGMIDLLPILSYWQLFQGGFSVENIEKTTYDDFSSHIKNECIFTLKNNFAVPKRISYGTEHFYLSAYQDTTKISIKIYDGELKFFYPNYKDYYYLPKEDTAIHKSVAFYVDKDYRTKAKAATCYSKKTGCFLPQYDIVISPYFKLEYHDRMTYFELTDDLLQNEQSLKSYALHVLTYLLHTK